MVSMDGGMGAKKKNRKKEKGKKEKKKMSFEDFFGDE